MNNRRWFIYFIVAFSLFYASMTANEYLDDQKHERCLEKMQQVKCDPVKVEWYLKSCMGKS